MRLRRVEYKGEFYFKVCKLIAQFPTGSFERDDCDRGVYLRHPLEIKTHGNKGVEPSFEEEAYGEIKFIVVESDRVS